MAPGWGWGGGGGGSILSSLRENVHVMNLLLFERFFRGCASVPFEMLSTQYCELWALCFGHIQSFVKCASMPFDA